MKRYASGGLVNTMYLLGAALAKNDIVDKGKEEEVQMTDQNILVNHAYTLLEAKEIGQTGHGEKVRLCTRRRGGGRLGMRRK